MVRWYAPPGLPCPQVPLRGHQRSPFSSCDDVAGRQTGPVGFRASAGFFSTFGKGWEQTTRIAGTVSKGRRHQSTRTDEARGMVRGGHCPRTCGVSTPRFHDQTCASSWLHEPSVGDFMLEFAQDGEGAAVSRCLPPSPVRRWTMIVKASRKSPWCHPGWSTFTILIIRLTVRWRATNAVCRLFSLSRNDPATQVTTTCPR